MELCSLEKDSFIRREIQNLNKLVLLLTRAEVERYIILLFPEMAEL